MKIAKVNCRVLRVPYEFPLNKGTKYAFSHFVEIETDDGLKGYSVSAAPMRHGLAEFINHELGPAIHGMDAMRPEQVRQTLLWATSGKYFMGAWSCAASLIDIALWDIKGKALSQPIWKLLGGASSELTTYVTFGLPTYTLDELVEVGTTLVKEGHKGLKIMVGTPPNERSYRGPSSSDIGWDTERVVALRNAVGPGIALMIDANKALTLTQALALSRRCEPSNLTWFEDPVLQGDPRLMAQLRKQTSVPIAAGSTGTSDLFFLRDYLLLDAVDYLQPNVRDIGGFTEGAKAAALAQAFNVPLSMGGQYPHFNMHLHAGAPNGGRIEFHYESWRSVEALFDGPPEPTNGVLTLPEGPGLGFTPKQGIMDLAAD